MEEHDRFARFTERARKVMALAQEESQRFQHNYIGTEHLLLGLVREGEGIAARALMSLGVELNKVRSAVEFIIGRGDRIILGEIGLTPRAKKVIELAVDEARRLNHHYIGTEHILLGLIREGEGIAAGVLESLGLNLERVRRATIQVLNGEAVSVNDIPTAMPYRASPAMAPWLCIAARGDDAPAFAAHLHAQLAAAFGHEQVFSDATPAPLGWDWREYLRRHVEACTVLLLVVGPAWSGSGDAPANLLDPNDPLFIQVETALSHRKPIIPLFVSDARMPPAEQLPEALRDIAYYQGMPIRPEPDSDEDIAQLVAELRQMA